MVVDEVVEADNAEGDPTGTASNAQYCIQPPSRQFCINCTKSSGPKNRGIGQLSFISRALSKYLRAAVGKQGHRQGEGDLGNSVHGGLLGFAFSWSSGVSPGYPKDGYAD